MLYQPIFTAELNSAINNNDLEKVTNLLDNFDSNTINSPNKTDFDKRRPIDCAAEADQTGEIIKLLFDKGANLNAQNELYGDYPITRVVRRKITSPKEIQGCIKALEAFANCKADFNVKNDKTKQTLLHIAILHNNIEKLAEALHKISQEIPININAEDIENKTPLNLLVNQYGIDNNLIDLFEILGGKTYSVGAQKIAELLNKKPFQQKKEQNASDALLNAGADPTSQNNDGDTPFHLAASFGNVYNFRHMLNSNSSKGKHPFAIKNNFDETPLDLAFLKDNGPTLRKLLYDEVIQLAVELDIKSFWPAIKLEGTRNILKECSAIAASIKRHFPEQKETIVTSEPKKRQANQVDSGNSYVFLKKARFEGDPNEQLIKSKADSIAKAVIAGNSIVYKSLMNSIEENPNKNNIIELIIKKCEQNTKPAKDRNFFDLCIDELKKTLPFIKP